MDTFFLHRKMLKELGFQIEQTTKILDWGCGSGAYVESARSQGFDCVGCDFSAKGPYLSEIEKPYRLPYPDASFDLVVSSGVLEHCMDYEGSLKELNRVLKPQGSFLHFFPPKWALFEHHIHVPFAGAIQWKWWLKLWASLGVRNVYQRHMSAEETAADNHKFLKTGTNYLSRREVSKHFSRYFRIRFCEDVFFRNTDSGARRLPSFLAPAYRTFQNCMLYGFKEL